MHRISLLEAVPLTRLCLHRFAPLPVLSSSLGRSSSKHAFLGRRSSHVETLEKGSTSHQARPSQPPPSIFLSPDSRGSTSSLEVARNKGCLYTDCLASREIRNPELVPVMSQEQTPRRQPGQPPSILPPQSQPRPQSASTAPSDLSGKSAPSTSGNTPARIDVARAEGVAQSPILSPKPAGPSPIVQPSKLADRLGSVSLDAAPAATPAIPRNVSFSTESAESKAYREHNPPTVIRQLDAARAKGLAPNESALHLTAPPRGGAPRFASPPAPATAAPAQAAAAPVAPNAGVRIGGASVALSTPEPSTASPQLAPQEEQNSNELHILLAVTGSVATIKISMIIHKLKQIYHQRAIIQLVATSASRLFFDPSDIPRDVKVWYDEDEWKSRELKPKKTGLPVTTADHQLHVQLRRWADILVVAPCSANTLAKLTYGICDNLLTSVFRVWNPAVPILLAPAMNTHMYTNPVTKRHYNTLKEEFPFVEILKPVEKVLVCGDIGMGGMREWTDIVQTVAKRLGIPPEEEDEDEDEDDSESRLVP